MRGHDTLKESLKRLAGSGLTDEQILSAVSPRLRGAAASKLSDIRKREVA